MDEKIRFKIVDGEINPKIKSVQIYRSYKSENDEIKWGYVDSLHPMSIMDLTILKNTLNEYLFKNEDF
jgi:hypothetical protein|tara:strand:+ start:953 stop:1156 length:204 start_codon:yes stop_codon:yes gene_type:complete